MGECIPTTSISYVVSSLYAIEHQMRFTINRQFMVATDSSLPIMDLAWTASLVPKLLIKMANSLKLTNNF